MKLDDIAKAMGKSREEVEEMFRKDDVIELKLTERKSSEEKEKGTIESL